MRDMNLFQSHALLQARKKNGFNDLPYLTSAKGLDEIAITHPQSHPIPKLYNLLIGWD